MTSWGVDTAIRANGSVVSATFASIATGLAFQSPSGIGGGGGFIAAILLDASSSSLMDKITRVFVSKKR